mgnify:CR=1 FL=1
MESPARQMKNPLVLIMSVLLVITVVIAGLFYFQIKKSSKELSKYQAQTSPTPSITPDPTSNWKTYINDKFGVEFRYPIGWPVPKELLQSINFNGKLIIVKGPFYDQALQRDLNFDEYAVRSYGDETPRYDFNMNGLIGKRGLENSVSNYSNIVVLAKDNKSTDIITISYIYDPKKEDGKVFDQILSTFKFLDAGGEGQFCGGIAGAVCPEGYSCKYDGNYPDAGGVCTKEEIKK